MSSWARLSGVPSAAHVRGDGVAILLLAVAGAAAATAKMLADGVTVPLSAEFGDVLGRVASIDAPATAPEIATLAVVLGLAAVAIALAPQLRRRQLIAGLSGVAALVWLVLGALGEPGHDWLSIAVIAAGTGAPTVLSVFLIAFSLDVLGPARGMWLIAPLLVAKALVSGLAMWGLAALPQQPRVLGLLAAVMALIAGLVALAADRPRGDEQARAPIGLRPGSASPISLLLLCAIMFAVKLGDAFLGDVVGWITRDPGDIGTIFGWANVTSLVLLALVVNRVLAWSGIRAAMTAAPIASAVMIAVALVPTATVAPVGYGAAVSIGAIYSVAYLAAWSQMSRRLLYQVLPLVTLVIGGLSEGVARATAGVLVWQGVLLENAVVVTLIASAVLGGVAIALTRRRAGS